MSWRQSIAAIASGALLLAAIAASGTAQPRPSSYSEFDASIAPGDAKALRAAILDGRRSAIYLQRGRYVLDNPVVIDRKRPLFLHGADRIHVELVAKDPARPLFLVRNAPLLNFAGVNLWPSAGSDETLDARAI